VRSDVRLDIFDILGRKIRTLVNEELSAGYKAVVWDGTDLQGRRAPTGIYLYCLQAGDFVESKKMMLLK